MSEKSFATSLSCMDGRVQLPMINLIKEKYSVDFVDTITAPGIDKVIFNGDIESIKKSVIISVSNHKSSHIVISGHFGCAGNPVSDEEHFTHIKKSVEIVTSWNLGVDVIGVWIDENFIPHLI
jgi:carbonic anhydrase|tara:strand:+ start:1401 stop:1769 length:369 start_codon:yes stop_codon:yes gene_type:complete